MDLIIVESPTKARTFNRILKNKDYFVVATLGHIRDLPYDEMGIDFEHSFEPKYQIMQKKQKVVDKLIEGLKTYNKIILATDPDREGESISYHVASILGFVQEKWPDFSLVNDSGRLQRIVFHEITQNALKEALANPSQLRTNLVKAQQARRIVDRIVGYDLSPLLWKKTGKNWLSAGRVQSVALRLIVEREKERRLFKEEDYFLVYGYFNEALKAELVSIKNTDIKQSITIPVYAGEYTYTKTTITNENKNTVEQDLQNDSFSITNIEEKETKKYPPPPFTTSILQQDAFYKLGFTSKMVMKMAQDLYEAGLITYHRTDSFNLSSQFVFRAKDYIVETYGKEYALDKPRGYRTKSKLAQEAHEAIRPTRFVDAKHVGGKGISKKIGSNHKRLYDLIFKRALATQMKEADLSIKTITITSKKEYCFKSEQQKILFLGFLKLYKDKKDSPENEFKSDLKIGTVLDLEKSEFVPQKTSPPPSYNEASLIKTLEEKGIGRPSTYAPIISLILEKGYVEKDGRYFHPTPLGEPISDYLAKEFSELFNLGFTSKMEDVLDEIAEGKTDLLTMLTQFYTPFKNQLEKSKESPTKIVIHEETNEKCPKCGKPLVAKISRFGKFFACSGYPECKFIKSIQKKLKNAVCPKCKGDIVIKYTKSKKRFYGCSNYPKCDYSRWTMKEVSDNISNGKS